MGKRENGMMLVRYGMPENRGYCGGRCAEMETVSQSSSEIWDTRGSRSNKRENIVFDMLCGIVFVCLGMYGVGRYSNIVLEVLGCLDMRDDTVSLRFVRAIGHENIVLEGRGSSESVAVWECVGESGDRVRGKEIEKEAPGNMRKQT
jgi:hypothetical protein